MEKRVLIARWVGTETQPFPIYDEASVSSARQRVREIGQRLKLGKELVESVALIASELTHNQLSHATQGYFAVRPVEREDVTGLEVVAADIGPGVDKPKAAIEGKDSTDGRSLGAGLAAVCRIADEVEFDNRISEGVCIIARKFETRPAPACCDVAIMGKPYPGEAISGDDGIFVHLDSGFLAAVSDGLGHGPEARQASNRAMETLSRNPQLDLKETAVALSKELAGTRGCAISVVHFKKDDRVLECLSLGDVHTHLYNLREALFFASTPLILGGADLPRQRVRIETATVEPGSVLVIFTDGLKSKTSLKGQLDVLRQPPISVAQHLLENDSRPDDDALVLVARFTRNS